MRQTTIYDFLDALEDHIQNHTSDNNPECDLCSPCDTGTAPSLTIPQVEKALSAKLETASFESLISLYTTLLSAKQAGLLDE